MAPKNKKPKDKKGKVGEVAKGRSIGGLHVSEREQYLQKELATLTEHVQMFTQRMQHFQLDNEFLHKEAQQIRETSKAYLTYLTRRMHRCQNAIISLNDQNRSDLAQVRKQKAELTSQYKDKAKEVGGQLFELEAKYSLMSKEVEDLQPCKELQLEHLTRIRELEKELLVMKIQHSEQMHRVKSQFLLQKAEYEMQAQQRVQALAREAEKEGVRCLIQHTKKVKADNWRLRYELLDLIRQAQVQNSSLRQLREQQQLLLREHQYSQDLVRMRHWLMQPDDQLVVSPGDSFKHGPSVRSRKTFLQATHLFMESEQGSSRISPPQAPPDAGPVTNGGEPSPGRRLQHARSYH